VAVGLLVARAEAQDTNYWTSQFGNQARLLGGAVIGSAEDVSAVYYNPGRLALLESVGLVLAGNVFQYTKISFENAFEGGYDLSFSTLGSVPGLFAGEIRLEGLGESRLAYSFLTRTSSFLRIEQQFQVPGLAGLPDADLVAGIALEDRLDDYWGGLTWSTPLSERVGFGISGFVTVDTRRHRGQTTAIVQLDTLAAVALQNDNYDYTRVGALAKVGIGADLDSWSIGATLTTPRLGIAGSGRSTYAEVIVAEDLSGGGNSASSVLTDLQEDVPVAVRSPLSLGAGVAYAFGRTRLHTSIEWFDGIGRYAVLDRRPVAAEDGGTQDIAVEDERKSVINYALGLEQQISPGLRGFASFTSDYTSAADKSDASGNFSIWNIYHIAAGATFRALSSEFTIGAIYAYGREDLVTSVSLVPDEGADGDGGRTVPAKFDRITAILGFTIGL
jgi:hypothetical protein